MGSYALNNYKEVKSVWMQWHNRAEKREREAFLFSFFLKKRGGVAPVMVCLYLLNRFVEYLIFHD